MHIHFKQGNCRQKALLLVNNWAAETEHKEISNFVLHFVTSSYTTEHTLMRPVLHFMNDTNTVGAFASLRSHAQGHTKTGILLD
jgi:hypothetical protein